MIFSTIFIFNIKDISNKPLAPLQGLSGLGQGHVFSQIMLIFTRP